ncbi:MAG: GtrA family protein [Candidatus Kerfeldbacteria bacterium]|nr:GtrA family protein [Candidatus Kerfeldbacteria bacterium]
MKDLVHGLLTTARSPRTGWQLPVIRQFVKFGIVGVTNTLTSIGIYTLLTRPFHLDPLLANIPTFLIAVTQSFFLNSRWTFRWQEGSSIRQYSKFLTINLLGLALSESFLFFFHRLLNIHDFVAFLMTITVVVFWNFSANRTWTFPQKPRLR